MRLKLVISKAGWMMREENMRVIKKSIMKESEPMTI